jgi:hypothetical protein
VKKLQRTAGFQTDRGEYQPRYPAWSTTGLVTISNTRPLPYKYIAPVTKQTDQLSPDRRTDPDRWTDRRTNGQELDLGFKTSTERRTDGSRSEFQDLDFQNLDRRTDNAINIVDWVISLSY